jgi:hypothetical protein
MLGTAGCTFAAPQATLIQYDPSDGVSLNVGAIQLRNAFVVSPDGEAANFVGVLINTSNSAKAVTLQYTSHVDDKTTRSNIEVDLEAGQVISFGDPKVPQLIFDAINVQPGALFTVFVQYGTTSGKNVQLPVLNGTESAYRKLVPSPTPTPTSIPTSTPTPDPTDSPATN